MLSWPDPRSIPSKHRDPRSIDPRSTVSYQWPGNVRELENTVERALILNKEKDAVLVFNELPGTGSDAPDSNQPASKENISTVPGSFDLDLAMARHIRNALKLAKGKVEGKGGAAELLNINPYTLRHRMKKLGVKFGRKAKMNKGTDD